MSEIEPSSHDVHTYRTYIYTFYPSPHLDVCSIDVEKAKSLGLDPGPEYKELKMGRDVVLANGNIIRSQDVVGPPQKGRKIVILGDTSDPHSLVPLAMDADIVVHEATLPDEMMQTAIERGHSTPGMAGKFARAVNAKHLILTHFGGGFSHDTEYVETVMVDQARATFGSDNVTAARDHMLIDILPHRNCKE